MATYNIFELFNTITEVYADGFTFVDIMELSEDNEESIPTSLSFSAIDEDDFVTEYDPVESCKIPDGYFEGEVGITIKPFDDCIPVGFTLDELASLHHAVSNALEYFKECSSDKKCSKENLDEIKRASVSCRNLQAKLVKILNRCKP